MFSENRLERHKINQQNYTYRKLIKQRNLVVFQTMRQNKLKRRNTRQNLRRYIVADFTEVRILFQFIIVIFMIILNYIINIPLHLRSKQELWQQDQTSSPIRNKQAKT
ncbi:Hypothetical_protein [Hexamita inflata]|uniref:Hypothetical_protein n=1 Tax=Hexamita inflata TaxID=28002 RepID=A0AA86QRA8_9EUKA|nr:Hypothetical protein HINF_LOCUS52236 [Hexamita inflata]